MFGVIGDPDAASLCYLGLQKLQHRGEEGAGIVAANPETNKLQSVTGLGLVTDVFASPESLKSLPGTMAIGHVRYSTSGGISSLKNVQPFLASYRFGQLAVSHNGNLLNHDKLKMELESRGSIFNTSSDKEVIFLVYLLYSKHIKRKVHFFFFKFYDGLHGCCSDTSASSFTGSHFFLFILKFQN